jgi:hypothetical protein
MLEIIISFGKIPGYKISIQKLVASLNTNNKLTEKINRETVPSTIASKPIKYLGINLTKYPKTFLMKTTNH